MSDTGLGYDLPTQVALLAADVRGMRTDQAKITVALDLLTTEVHGRPSWTVTTLLAISTACNGALLSALIIVLTRK